MTAFVMQELITEDADPYAIKYEELIDLQAPPFRKVFDALSIFTNESIRYIFPDTTPKKYSMNIDMASEILAISIDKKWSYENYFNHGVSIFIENHAPNLYKEWIDIIKNQHPDDPVPNLDSCRYLDEIPEILAFCIEDVSIAIKDYKDGNKAVGKL